MSVKKRSLDRRQKKKTAADRSICPSRHRIIISHVHVHKGYPEDNPLSSDYDIWEALYHKYSPLPLPLPRSPPPLLRLPRDSCVVKCVFVKCEPCEAYEYPHPPYPYSSTPVPPTPLPPPLLTPYPTPPLPPLPTLPPPYPTPPYPTPSYPHPDSSNPPTLPPPPTLPLPYRYPTPGANLLPWRGCPLAVSNPADGE